MDLNEQVSETLKREFSEEALNSTVVDDDAEREEIVRKVDEAFQSGGYEVTAVVHAMNEIVLVY